MGKKVATESRTHSSSLCATTLKPSRCQRESTTLMRCAMPTTIKMIANSNLVKMSRNKLVSLKIQFRYTIFSMTQSSHFIAASTKGQLKRSSTHMISVRFGFRPTLIMSTPNFIKSGRPRSRKLACYALIAKR